VYRLHQDDEDQSTFAELIRRPLAIHGDAMYLNLYEEHLSYVTDFKKYANSWSYCKFGQKFTHHGYQQARGTMHRNYKIRVSRWGVKRTIFEKLQDEGILIQEKYRYYPYRAMYDIECLLKPISGQQTPKMTWEGVHEPNVPGFTEPKCFISEGDPATLVETFL